LMKNTPRSVKLLTIVFITLIAIILVAGYAAASFIMLTVLLYTSIVASKLYTGRLVSAITTSLNLLSVPTFVALLPSWEGASPYFKPVSYSILLGVLAYSSFLIVNSVSESYWEIMNPASRSMLLFLLGLNLWYLSSQIISPTSGVLGGIGYFFLFSFSGTAILSLFEALRGLQGRTISLVASFLGRNLASRSVFLVLIFAYLFIIRVILFSIFPGAQSLLIVAEWGTLSVLVLRSYWRFNVFVENEYVKPDQIEDWSRHVQSVEWMTDRRMEGVADSIQDFLNRGVKDSLIVFLVGLMRDAGELDDSIASSLSPLIEYEDLRPGVVFHSSQVEYIEEQNRKRRLAIFTGALSQLSKIGLKIKFPEGKLPQKGKKGELKRI
jgi:hypothetical protein